MDIITVITLLVICFFVGHHMEETHYKSIKSREKKFYKNACIGYSKEYLKDAKIKNSFLVSSSVVVGCDYFKTFLAGILNFFGGNLSVYESVMDRGRREAILRMQEQAFSQRANKIINVKVDTIILASENSNAAPIVCVTSYGTAVEQDF